MTVQFRRGIRENVNLWVNLIGGTGGGKTYTGMKLAKGIAGDKPFAVVDTENRRALHYADQFAFDHAELRPPFRPEAYADAVVAADAAGYPVVMIDSGSHVWAGDGGVLDWQEEELDEMVKRAAQRNDRRPEWEIREAGKMAAWIKPKMAHKQMVQKLLQVKAHIILCLRAEQKIEMVREDDPQRQGKKRTVIRPKESLTGKDGWIPVCDKNLPFEATCSFLLLADKPGIPHPIKLQEQHRSIFPLDKPINEESGERLANWARGQAVLDRATARTGVPTSRSSETVGDPKLITADQATQLEVRCHENGIDPTKLKKAIAESRGYKIERFAQMRAEDHERAVAWIDAVLENRKSKEKA